VLSVINNFDAGTYYQSVQYNYLTDQLIQYIIFLSYTNPIKVSVRPSQLVFNELPCLQVANIGFQLQVSSFSK